MQWPPTTRLTERIGKYPARRYRDGLYELHTGHTHAQFTPSGEVQRTSVQGHNTNDTNTEWIDGGHAMAADNVTGGTSWKISSKEISWRVTGHTHTHNLHQSSYRSARKTRRKWRTHGRRCMSNGVKIPTDLVAASSALLLRFPHPRVVLPSQN